MRSLRSFTAAWSDIAELLRLRNQTGTFLLLLPTLWALVLAADGRPPALVIAIFIVGTFIMRTVGVTINDVFDRNIDRQVERTRNRPLAAGRLSVKVAATLVAALLLIAAGLLSLLNPFTIALAPIALLFVVSYPFAKRTIALPQIVLGMAFGWGTIMAWAAVRSEVGWPAVAIFLATVCWAIGYDTIYALQDRDDDRRLGVGSSAVLFGRWLWLIVLLVLLAMLALLMLVGLWLKLGPVFYLALAGSLGWFGYQAVRLKQYPPGRTEAFALFQQHVWIGVLILAGIWGGLLMK
jgi:4-hydroxybenzoate polyprenyltransferase